MTSSSVSFRHRRRSCPFPDNPTRSVPRVSLNVGNIVQTTSEYRHHFDTSTFDFRQRKRDVNVMIELGVSDFKELLHE